MKNQFGGAAVDLSLVKWIKEFIPVDDTIVELGSGTGSTQYLCQYYNLFSVENNLKWLNKYHSNYIYSPLINDWYDPVILRNKLPQQYTLLLIDGPIGHRRPNIIQNYELFSPEKYVILDDIERKGEKRIKNFLVNIGYKCVFESKPKNKKHWGVFKVGKRVKLI